jgi:TPR repeat protein
MAASVSPTIQSGSVSHPNDQDLAISPDQQHYDHNNGIPHPQDGSFHFQKELPQAPGAGSEHDGMLMQDPQQMDEQQFMQHQQFLYEQQLFQQQQQQQYEQELMYQQQSDAQQDQSVLSHSHLKPGHKATLLSYTQTLELYRQNAKKTNDPELQFEFAAFMIDAGKPLEDPQTRAELFDEAMKLLRKLATNGHAESQHYLAECFASGFAKGKPDFDKAFPLWVQASKHGHPDAAYRTGRCYDEGLGTRKDNARAVQFYR